MRISTTAFWVATLSSAATGVLVILLAQPDNPWPPALAVLATALVGGLGAGSAMARARAWELETGERTRKLEERLRGKDEFLTNTVHELRTPLSTVLASLDMLQDGYAVTSEDRTSFIEQASTATRHLTFLINDLLDTAAFEAGKLRLHLRPCPIRDIATDAERLMIPLARARGVSLSIERPLVDLEVIGDHGRILQVIFNLVSNALKFSPDHGVVVLRTITTEIGAVFEVEDEGVGVPLAARKSLFTRFSRVESPDKPGAQGAGIGLYVSRMLVELMNGSIGFHERDKARGSVFWFTLPMAPAVEQSPSQGVGQEAV